MSKYTRRQRIKFGIRKIVTGTAERPRMSIFRSNRHISVQIIDDVSGVTLVSESTVSKDNENGSMTKIEQAALIGKKIAEKAKEKGIERVVFDRNGYLYHGRVKSVAEEARKNGLII